MGRVIIWLSAIVTAAVFGTSAVFAQQQPFFEFRACEGEISSLAPGVIPDTDAYAVDIFDPTDTALKFRDVFLAELSKAGRPTSQDGNLVFSFRSESIFRGITSRTQVNPTFRGDRSTSGPSQRSDEAETRALIESDRPTRRRPGSASQQILVEAELRNNETQRVVWLASIRCDPLTSDENLLMKFVSEVFVQNLGAAVKQKAF